MLEKIFGSRTRVKIFRLFLTQPSQEFFVREISRLVDEQIHSVRRELLNCERIGLLKSFDRDLKKFYFVNKDFVLYEELRALILKSRLTLEKAFIESIKRLGSIEYLALAGYFVGDLDAKVDLFIVGQIQNKNLEAMLQKFKSMFGANLRFTVLTRDEYKYRKDVTDKFLYEILNGKKVVILDRLNP